MLACGILCARRLMAERMSGEWREKKRREARRSPKTLEKSKKYPDVKPWSFYKLVRYQLEFQGDAC